MKFYFITGSQDLYGEETLAAVALHTREMADTLNASPEIPYDIEWKPTVRSPREITDVIEAANYDRECAGIITFMHTFSPSKMWVDGLTKLQKPYCHFHTQFNREIPWNEIDMDFMNLNQSAHGDREHGFIGARLRMPRKIIVGYWRDCDTQRKIADFMRAAAGVFESRSLRVARIGDNMREVAVTEGDKVEAQIKLGWSVNGWGLGDIVRYVDTVTDSEADAKYEEILPLYTLKTDDIASVKYQIKIELGLRRFLENGGFGAFTTTFENLYGLRQLPGMAVQRLMADGWGFGAEGDWKTAALLRVMKVMAHGKAGGTAFMEDYTYDFSESVDRVLGAHMLEVCPSICKAGEKPAIEVHPLGIGGKEPPARLTFDGASGEVILCSLVDMGGRMRMIVQEAFAAAPHHKMPRLPVAATMWMPYPDLQTAAQAWLCAGGAHHTVMSYALNSRNMRDFCEMLGIECIVINKNTDIDELKKELLYNDIAYKFNI